MLYCQLLSKFAFIEVVSENWNVEDSNCFKQIRWMMANWSNGKFITFQVFSVNKSDLKGPFITQLYATGKGSKSDTDITWHINAATKFNENKNKISLFQ